MNLPLNDDSFGQLFLFHTFLLPFLLLIRATLLLSLETEIRVLILLVLSVDRRRSSEEERKRIAERPLDSLDFDLPLRDDAFGGRGHREKKEEVERRVGLEKVDVRGTERKGGKEGGLLRRKQSLDAWRLFAALV